MKCLNCNYKRSDNGYHGCEITHRVILNLETSECTLGSDQSVPEMEICFNCKHWIGGGDFGLSCRKDYYVATANGFSKCCDKFERKMEE